jgi:hypothetical protein
MSRPRFELSTSCALLLHRSSRPNCVISKSRHSGYLIWKVTIFLYAMSPSHFRSQIFKIRHMFDYFIYSIILSHLDAFCSLQNQVFPCVRWQAAELQHTRRSWFGLSSHVAQDRWTHSVDSGAIRLEQTADSSRQHQRSNNRSYFTHSIRHRQFFSSPPLHPGSPFALWPTQPPNHLVPGTLFSEVKRPESEAGNSSPFRVLIMDTRLFTKPLLQQQDLGSRCTVPVNLWGVQNLWASWKLHAHTAFVHVYAYPKSICSHLPTLHSKKFSQADSNTHFSLISALLRGEGRPIDVTVNRFFLFHEIPCPVLDDCGSFLRANASIQSTGREQDTPWSPQSKRRH